MKKKIGSLFMVLIMFFVVNGNVWAEFSPINGTKLNFKSIGEREASNGEEINMVIEIENLVDSFAKNFIITPVIDSKSPFKVENIDAKIIDRIYKGENAIVEFSFNVKDDVAAGFYDVTFEYEYLNFSDQAITGKIGFPIEIEKEETLADFEISNIDKPEKIVLGDEFNLSFDIEDKNDVFPTEVKISIDQNSDQNIVSIDEKSIYIPAISQNDYLKNVEFGVKVSELIKSGKHPVIINFEYTDRLGNVQSEQEKIYIEVVEAEGANLSVNEIIQVSEKITPGEEFRIKYIIENTGDTKAENIILFIDGKDKLKIKGKSSIKIPEIDVNEAKEIEFIFEPFTTAEFKNANIVLTGEYSGEDNGEKKSLNKNYTVYVGEKSRMVVQNINTSKESISEDEYFDLEFDILNEGDGAADNVEVSLELSNALIIRSESVQVINEIKSGEVKRFKFRIQGSDKVEDTNYSIKIKAFEQGNPSDITTQYATIQGEKAVNNGQPRIIVDKYNIKDEIVAGESFELEMFVKNTSKLSEISNVKVIFSVLGESNNSIFPYNQSNSIYIGALNPEETIEKKVEMFVGSNAEMKVYSLVAKFEYNDSEGNKYEDEEVINIQVTQPYEIMTSKISAKPIGNNGSVLVSTNFYNVGKSDLENLLITVEGDFKADNPEYYVGSFALGKSDTYDVQITPSKGGKIDGTIIFAFNTEDGKSHTIEKELKVENVVREQLGQNMSGAIPNRANGVGRGTTAGNNTDLIKNGAIILLLGVVVIMFVMKKKKNKGKK